MRVRIALCAFTAAILAAVHLPASDAHTQPPPQAHQTASVYAWQPTGTPRPIDGQTVRQEQLARFYVWAARQPQPKPKTPVPGSRIVSRDSRTDAEIEACIIERENGGDYGRSSNPTHFGRYQYDRQTWIAHGGDPDTWGHASPEEQDAVFRNGVSQYGYGAWRPYNGC